MVQVGTHAGSNQYVDFGQRFCQQVITGMETLFHGNFDEMLAGYFPLLNFVYPEFPAFAGVFGDGFPILAGNSDLHDISFASDCRG